MILKKRPDLSIKAYVLERARKTIKLMPVRYRITGYGGKGVPNQYEPVVFRDETYEEWKSRVYAEAHK